MHALAYMSLGPYGFISALKSYRALDNLQLLGKAEYNMKNYGDRGGFYLAVLAVFLGSTE